jgi:2-polyprenyl-3-methyl-5-hydroxy-6-metoxy-1,4-benzoquinol methylase
MTTERPRQDGLAAGPVCFACRRPGAIRYRGAQDRLFGARGAWDLAGCESCGVLWLHPMPGPQEIAGFYATYYTHAADPPAARMQGFRQRVREAWAAGAPGRPRGGLAERLALAVPFVREELEVDHMMLRFLPPGRVLDVGCGSGGFLQRMQAIGWRIEGVELDPDAAALARSTLQGPVHASGFVEAGLPPAAFDAVTMNQVIEHVPDPLGYLCEAFRVCRPGGRLVLATPNARALGHRIFGADWRGLEVPRHLHLFTVGALAALVGQAGFRIVSARTTARGARAFFVASRMLARGGGDAHDRTVAAPLSDRLMALAFQAFEDALRFVAPEAGEEIVLVAEKPGDVAQR